MFPEKEDGTNAIIARKKLTNSFPYISPGLPIRITPFESEIFGVERAIFNLANYGEALKIRIHTVKEGNLER
jgi:hypothetical protein